MKTKKKIIIPVLILIAMLSVVSISGCIDQVGSIFSSLFGQAKSFFGMEVIKPGRSQITLGVNDPVVINKVWTLPQEKVVPDVKMQMYMEITSKDTDPTKPLKNLIVDLYDASLFKTPDGKFCNSDVNVCPPDRCSINSPCELKMGATKQLFFNLKAPSGADIASVITKAKLAYRVYFNYSGATNYEVLVVDYQEILRRQREGLTLSTNLQDSKGSGPIKIDAELMTPYAVASDEKTKSQSAYFVFKLRDAGSGMLNESRIEKEKLIIRFPKALVIDTVDKPEVNPETKLTLDNLVYDKDTKTNTEECIPYFKCELSGEYIECKNTRCIKLFRKESEPMQFMIKNVPSLPNTVPHRSFFIDTFVNYTYELRGSVEIIVDPSLTR